MPLSIHHIPLTFTFGILEEGENSSLGIDPSVSNLYFNCYSFKKKSSVIAE
jgi:hypothetical protein